jgi:hypothetical protein
LLEAGSPSGPPSDPVAMMEFYMKKAAAEEKKRPPRLSKDEMPPPPSLQGISFILPTLLGQLTVVKIPNNYMFLGCLCLLKYLIKSIAILVRFFS